MSDPTAPQTQPQDIGQQIAGATEKIWKRLQAALKVKTREQAVQLVAQDEAAAEAARAILATDIQDILTKRTTAPQSVLTGSRKRAPADAMYGGGGGLAI